MPSSSNRFFRRSFVAVPLLTLDLLGAASTRVGKTTPGSREP